MIEVGEPEIKAVARVLRSGELFRYHDGGEAQRFESEYATSLGARYVQLTASGTTALTSALASLGIGPGDEVITTPITFIATNAEILRLNAVPVFADVQYETHNIDPKSIREKITNTCMSTDSMFLARTMPP